MRKLCLYGERKMRVLKRKRAKNDKNFQKSAIYLDLIKKNDYNQNRRNADRECSVSKNRIEESNANA